jgi:hypothetical protein
VDHLRQHAERCLKAALFARTSEEADLMREIAANTFEQAFKLDQLKMNVHLTFEPTLETHSDVPSSSEPPLPKKN